jgi:hypothetical protein
MDLNPKISSVRHSKVLKTGCGFFSNLPRDPGDITDCDTSSRRVVGQRFPVPELLNQIRQKKPLGAAMTSENCTGFGIQDRRVVTALKSLGQTE